MKHCFRLIVSLCLLATLSATAGATLSRQVFVQDEQGTRIVRSDMPGEDTGASVTIRDALLWQHNITGNIYSSCAVAPTTLIGGSGNGASCPANYFHVSSGGVPDWTFTGGANQAHLRALTLAISEEIPAINGQRLHVYDADMPPTELWSKDVANVSLPSSCLRVSEDGSVVAVAYNSDTGCTVKAFDAATGAHISTFDSPAGQYARALRITEDGSRIVLRAGATLHAIDTATGTSIWTGNVGASADPLGLSPNGRWIASGWTFIFVYEWDGSTYQFRWSYNGGSSSWYLGTCAVADNGALIAGWYTTSYNQNKVHWFDAAAGNVPSWEYLFPVSGGSYQDVPSASAIDGYAAAMGSWGDQTGTNAEINIFRSSETSPVFSVNTSGSIYDLDMHGYGLPGGRYPNWVVACGKHVHANEFGSGGDLYLTNVLGPTAVPDGAAPAPIALSAHPNPFNPHSTLTLTLDAAGPARIVLYDAAGRRVRALLDGLCVAGENRVVWDGRDDAGQPAASGVYLARASAEGSTAVRRLVLLR